jgi:fructose-bisphosphate aldolase class I
LEKWAGKDENIEEAQRLLYERAHINTIARDGKYTPELERHPVA